MIAQQVAERINPSPETVKVLIPMGGWSEADRQGGPLYDPQSARVFLERLERDLDPRIEVRKVEHHINEQDFAREAARLMDQMLRSALMLT
ncbi:MAG: Tm-1-like ATP-binding domain-containing protein [Deltaproteobacteria bacterium]|nr:Tm-1-like ATP-binding domain-containing protein [Deltaproteobacteria bacterium]